MGTKKKNNFGAKLHRAASWATILSVCIPSHLVMAAANDPSPSGSAQNPANFNYQNMLQDPAFTLTINQGTMQMLHMKGWNDFKSQCGDGASVSTSKNCSAAGIKCNALEMVHWFANNVTAIKNSMQAKKDAMAASQLTASKKNTKPLELVQQKDVEAYCGKVPTLKSASNEKGGQTNEKDGKSEGSSLPLLGGKAGLQYAQNSRDGGSGFRGLRTRHVMKNITFNYPYDANMWGPTVRSTLTVSNLGETEIGAFSSTQLSSISWFNGQFCMYLAIPTQQNLDSCEVMAKAGQSTDSNPYKANYELWLSQYSTVKAAYYTAWMNLNTQLNGMFSNFKMSWIQSPYEAKLFRYSSKDNGSGVAAIDSVAATEGAVMKVGKMERLPGGHAVRYSAAIPYTIYPVMPDDLGNVMGIYSGQSVGGFKLPSITTLVALSAHVQVCDTAQGGLGVAQVDGDIDFVAGTKFVQNQVEAEAVVAETSKDATVACPLYATQDYLKIYFGSQLNAMLQATHTGPDLKMSPQKVFFSVGPF